MKRLVRLRLHDPFKPMTDTHNRTDLRHARATPLASIFGSRFLVIVPILNAAVGPYSVVAMAAVCALAYAMGSVIRFNIRMRSRCWRQARHRPGSRAMNARPISLW